MGKISLPPYIAYLDRKIDILANEEKKLNNAVGEMYSQLGNIQKIQTQGKPSEESALENYTISEVPISTEWNVFRPYTLYPPEVSIGFVSPVGFFDMITDAGAPLIGLFDGLYHGFVDDHSFDKFGKYPYDHEARTKIRYGIEGLDKKEYPKHENDIKGLKNNVDEIRAYLAFDNYMNANKEDNQA